MQTKSLQSKQRSKISPVFSDNTNSDTLVAASSKIVIGKFGRSFGVRGWIRVNSFADPKENIINYKNWLIQNKNKDFLPVCLEEVQAQSNQIVAKIINCDSPESVRFYTNLEIFIEKSALPALPKNKFYWSDLEGLVVKNQNNVELGFVDYVFATGANDVLVVKKNNQTQMIPFIKSTVKKVDLENKLIVVET